MALVSILISILAHDDAGVAWVRLAALCCGRSGVVHAAVFVVEDVWAT